MKLKKDGWYNISPRSNPFNTLL